MKKHWIFSILLSLPVFLFYASHFSSVLTNDQVIPTGFIQTDQVSYMANAREYGERGGFALQYPLPFSSNYDNQAIYFQPQLFVLGQVMRILPIDPGILLMLFGFLFTILCIRLCIVIFTETTGISSGIPSYIGMTLFIWGGGLLCVAGGFYELLSGNGLQHGLKSLLILDPGTGWWFLNLGRNFLYPMEAYYHFLFFGIVYAAYKQHFKAFLFLLALLVFSHPFTGTAALLICTTWVSVERFYIRRIVIPNYVFAIFGIILIAHFSYYFPYLRANEEHRFLMKQWALDWSMTAESFIPAYAIVGLLVLLRMASPRKLISVLSNPFNRFLLIWAVINFLLENHEFAIPAHQPLHFTRGYTWSALFLLGYPVVKNGITVVFSRFSPIFAKILLSIFFLIFLSDNLVWFSHYLPMQRTEIGGIKITPDQQETLDFLSTLKVDKRLLVCRDYHISYMATVYTGFRPIYAHRFNTANYKKKIDLQDAFIKQCRIDTFLKGKSLVVVYDLERDNCFMEKKKLIFENKRYVVYEQEL